MRKFKVQIILHSPTDVTPGKLGEILEGLLTQEAFDVRALSVTPAENAKPIVVPTITDAAGNQLAVVDGALRATGVVQPRLTPDQRSKTWRRDIVRQHREQRGDNKCPCDVCRSARIAGGFAV